MSLGPGGRRIKFTQTEKGEALNDATGAFSNEDTQLIPSLCGSKGANLFTFILAEGAHGQRTGIYLRS